MEKFLITKEQIKVYKRFSLHGRTLEFKIKPVPQNVEPISWVRDAIQDIVEYSVADLESHNMIGFTFNSKDFSRGEGWMRFKSVSDVCYTDIWKMISGIYQSNSTALSTETFCLSVSNIKMPCGQGQGGKYNTFNEECAKRKGIITIKNNDNLCLARALVVAIAYKIKDPNYNKLRLNRNNSQFNEACKLIQAAGVTIPEAGSSIPEVEAFQNFFGGKYKIAVYQYGNKGRNLIFRGDSNGEALNLLFHEGHFNVITSLTAAFGCRYYCENCSLPYNNKGSHRCAASCSKCFQSPKCPEQVRIMCKTCNRSFYGQSCYENHIQHLICEKFKLCPSCFKTVKEEHECGKYFCKTCCSLQPDNHNCYMQVDKKKPITKETIFIFYDLETRQEKLQTDGSLLHEPNLCVFKQCCNECIESNIAVCTKCGLRLQIVKCDDPISPFIDHILTIRKKFKKVIIIGHNAGGFDHHFLLNSIITKTDLTPKLINRGTKLILMQVENVRFLDSINYFPMPLSKLPKAFDLKELKKGYFPHLFNTIDNSNYVGTLPPIKYYSPDEMRGTDDQYDDERKVFLRWYEEHKNDIFDFQKEIVDYCVSDMEILTQACLKFRKLMMDEGNVCPFTEATTLPAACNLIFRRNFLAPNTIGLIPKGGYRWRDTQSRIAIQWLVWEGKQRGIEIIHAANQREAVVGGHKVDGSYGNQVFEFHGCYFHGCPRCFKYNRDQPLREDKTSTLNLKYEQTLAKIDKLKSLGYEVIEKWECDFKLSPEMLTFFDNHPLISKAPLNPRDAFYGGRTGNILEYYRIQSHEKIKFVDVNSLYPWVNKYGKYPVGHPEVFVGEKCMALNLKETDGLIKCKILPPQNLYHPVLPSKINQKLMFVLCRTCCEEVNMTDCMHSDDERALEGTWVIDEVLKALEKGYEMIEIYEIWKFKTEQYDPVTKTGGLFADYISKFLKIKQQASGWPLECTDEIDKIKFVEEYYNKEGVSLNSNEIMLNPGLRQLGKAVITSFWGKLGQRENQSKTALVRTPSEFYRMLTDQSIYVNTVTPVNDDVLLVNWEYKEDSYETLATVNVCLAAYTTAQARLKLYSYLELLEEKVLYFDTDSVMYVSRPGEYEIPIGGFLGDMNNELTSYGAGSYIVEFVSGGPKNYAYQVFSPETNKYYITCKVKGITLNYDSSKLINMEIMKKMVLETRKSIPITYKKIKRTTDFSIITKEETKTYRATSGKRKFLADHTSVPFGYNEKKMKLL